MSSGALHVMIFVLVVVWGGAALALFVAWRQERRQASGDTGSEKEDDPAT